MAAFEEVLSCAKSVAQTAGRKTEELVEQTKTRVKIADLRREIASLYEGLGRLIYDSRTSGESVDDMVEACVEQIGELQSQLTKLEDRVMESKNVVRCECGTLNVNTAVFCNQCGKKLL